MSSSYQTQYYSQQPNNNNLGLLTTGALAGGGIATLASLRFMKKGKILQDLSQKGRDANIDAMAGKKYPVNKGTKRIKRKIRKNRTKFEKFIKITLNRD